VRSTSASTSSSSTGRPRTHPVHSTRLKAQKIKSRLSVNPELGAVWIQPLVVLARTPTDAAHRSDMTKFVTSIDRVGEVIADPTLIGLQRDRLPEHTRSVAKARLALDSMARKPRGRFGAYLADELLSSGGGHQWWRAHHEVFDTQVLLQVVPPDPLADPGDAARRTRGGAASGQGRASPRRPSQPARTETAFRADDGSIVVVHPISPAPDARVGRSWRISTTTAKRRTVAGVARLLEHCGRLGVAHRTLGPGSSTSIPRAIARVAGSPTPGSSGRRAPRSRRPTGRHSAVTSGRPRTRRWRRRALGRPVRPRSTDRVPVARRRTRRAGRRGPYAHGQRPSGSRSDSIRGVRVGDAGRRRLRHA
jgi:hypothetical protein